LFLEKRIFVKKLVGETNYFDEKNLILSKI